MYEHRLINDRSKYAHDFFSERNLPSFILEDDREHFLDFLNIYYRMVGWFSLEKYFDIDMDFSKFDVTPEKLELKNFMLDRFMRTFTPTIDRKNYSKLDFINFIKHVSQFYRIKGTNASIRFIYYLLFGTNAEVYIPWDDVVRLNSAYYGEKTQIQHQISTRFKQFEYDDITSIEQKDDEGNITFKAFIFDSKVEYFQNNIILKSLVGGVIGTYNPNVRLKYYVNDIVVAEGVLLKGLSKILFSPEMLEYETRRLYVENIPNGQVSFYKENEKKYSIDIINQGIGVDDSSRVLLEKIDGEIVNIPYESGYFLNYYDNPIQKAVVIQDGDYYQQHSYAVVSDFYSNMKCDVYDYYELLKRLTKPVETKMFQTINLFNYEKYVPVREGCEAPILYNGQYTFDGSEEMDGVKDTYCKEIPIPVSCTKYTNYLDER